MSQMYILQELMIFYQQNKINKMNNNPNDNLLDFLKKRSLFNVNTQTNSRKRSRSKSRSSRNFDKISNASFDDRDRDESAFQPLNRDIKLTNYVQQSNIRPQFPAFPPSTNTYSQHNTFQEQRNNNSHINNYQNERQYTSLYKAESNYNNNPNLVNMANFSTNVYKGEKSQVGSSFNSWNQVTSNASKLMVQQPYNNYSNYNSSRGLNNPWSSITSHSNSFQSARNQSYQCLQDISLKISSQIANITFKLDSFNAKMLTIVNRQFKMIKQQIYQIFQTAFRQSEKHIAEYLHNKEEQLAGEMKKMKQNLVREQGKINQMKQQLQKAEWKKVAGQILSTDLQNKIGEILAKCHKTQILYWQFDDIPTYRIKNIQSELKAIVRLKK